MKEKTNKTLEKLNNYEAFVEKFKPKKTTDDCYTPPYIYDTVLQWLRRNADLEGREIIRPFWPGGDYKAVDYPEGCVVVDNPPYIYDTVLQWLRRNADLEGREIIRPFWPGGDYKAVDYPEGCVVVDNPPFSILAEIKRFYLERGIRFFLFAPHLTLFSTDNAEVSYIIANTTVRYENGATVCTDFVTNLPEFAEYGIIGEASLKEELESVQRKALQEKGVKKVNGATVCTDFVTNLPEFAEYGIIGEASLKEELESVQRKALQEKGVKKVLPNYAYPSHLVTTSSVGYLINAGITVRIPRKEMLFVRRLDSQVAKGKGVFGGGFLTSNRMAEKLEAEKLEAEKLKAEKLKAEKPKAAHQWQLSERDLELIEKLI